MTAYERLGMWALHRFDPETAHRLSLFALKAASEELSTSAVYRAAWPVVTIFVAGMGLLWLCPWLVTLLPGALR